MSSDGLQQQKQQHQVCVPKTNCQTFMLLNMISIGWIQFVDLHICKNIYNISSNKQFK